MDSQMWTHKLHAEVALAILDDFVKSLFDLRPKSVANYPKYFWKGPEAAPRSILLSLVSLCQTYHDACACFVNFGLIFEFVVTSTLVEIEV